MATLGSLIISLEANTAKFTDAMTKAEYAAKKSSDNIASAMKVAGASIAGMVSIGAIDAVITRITSMESNLVKAAARLNTTAETLSSFSIVARKAGMDNDAFIMTLTRMEKGMSAAALGADQATGKFDENGDEILKTSKTYDELGLNVKELIKLPLDQQLQAIATAMKENIAPADRVRVAMELGGKGAAGMVTPLMQGGDAIKNMTARAKELLPMTDEMAKRGEAVKSATSDMSLAWEGFVAVLVDQVGPAIAVTLTKLAELIAQSTKASSANFKAQQGAIKYQEPKTLAETMGYVTQKPVATGLPAKVYKPPVRPPGKTGGGGKSGGGDMGLDRMQSIIDTLQKDLSRLTEGSLAEIREWANKTVNEIEKVGKKGADTETALALVAQVEAGKKKKVTEDYEGFVAEKSGNSHAAIEAEANSWLTKYKGFAGAEEQIAAIKAGKIWDLDVANQEKRLNMQKTVLDQLAQESPLLSQQLAIKAKILPIELELNRLALEKMIGESRISKAQADELRGLQALANQAKKYSLEREQWKLQGVGGGMKIAGQDMKEQADTWAADQTAALMKSMPQQVSTSMAQFFVDTLQGKKTDFMQMGEAMAGSMVQKLLEGILTQIIPQMTSALGDALGGIMGSIGGGGGGGIFGDILGGIGSIFGFHDGGIITAHKGWPLLPDERLIKAQTGERVLSRAQNRNYEAGIGGSGGGGTVVHAPISITIHPRQEMTQADYDRHARMIKNSLNKHIGTRGQGIGDGRY